MIGEGMTALAPTLDVSEEDIRYAKEIFDSVGRVTILDECHFNAVTGLSGSGPAYVYLFIQALADGGVRVGLPYDVAILLATQTIYGSAKMVLETGEQPERLMDMVTTPGGTTVRGLLELEKGKVRESMIRAVETATHRAKELGT
jgi:pyrroline-5-carboxylate reductase